jgi:hypothetical protein
MPRRTSSNSTPREQRRTGPLLRAATQDAPEKVQQQAPPPGLAPFTTPEQHEVGLKAEQGLRGNMEDEVILLLEAFQGSMCKSREMPWISRVFP